MFQDTAASDYKYNLFVKRVSELNLVWGLENEDGWASSHSNDYEGIEIILFWFGRTYATACAKDNWSSYKAKSIPLAEFLESWCIGMANDNTMIGTNWDPNMFGKEINTLTIALEIATLLKINKCDTSFLEYDDIDDFIVKLKQALIY